MSASSGIPARTLVGEALRTAFPPWRTAGPTLLYCLRTLAAIGIALYTAFALQLQSPLSSVITVLIVANPVTGALVSKSVWRLFGTLVGAAAAVLVMAVFGQSPMLFAIVFSLWIGLACIVSTLLRFFRAYGAVLAGYTLIIVCAPAFNDPENVFISALSRLSAVSVGIGVAALVFLLTSVRPPSRLAEATQSLIRASGATLAGHAAPPFRHGGDTPDDPGNDPGDARVSDRRRWRSASPGSLPGALYDQRGALLAQGIGLNEIIEYAAADSFAVARHAARLRLGAAGLVGTLTTLNPFYGRLGHHPDIADDVRQATEALAALRLEAPGSALAAVTARRDRLAAAYDAPGHPERGVDLDHLGAVEHAHDLLTRLHEAVSNLTQPSQGRRRPPAPRQRRYLDWPTALRNGARGSIVTMLAFLFWYITQWPSGPILLTYLVPAACLLATNPSASRASIDFSLGTLLAIPASYVCEAWMLPQISGFPLLFAALSTCLLPGIWLQFHPRHGLRAFGYVVFFNAMITVRNPISFDDIGLINGWLAFVMGTAALMVVFRALLPSNPRRDADRLVRSIVYAVTRLGGPRLPSLAAWEHLQMQKALLLTQRLQPLHARVRQEVTDCAFVTIELGRDVLRLRRLLADTALEPQEADAVAALLAAIGRLRHDPHEAASRADAAADLFAARAASSTGADAAGQPAANLSPASSGLRRIAALSHDIAVLTGAVPGFLDRAYTVASC